MEPLQDLPYEIRSDPSVGRFLVASRDIQPLEIIMVDTPSASGPNHKTQMVCLECLRYIDGSFLCPGCDYPMCDSACSGGPIHKKECRLLEKVKHENVISQEESDDKSGHHINYRLIMVLRMFLLKLEKSDIWNSVDALLDHEKERKENVLEWKMFQKTVVDIIKKIFPDASDEEIHRIIGIICINAVGFDFQKEKVKGRALYPCLSLVSHSCVSNARYNVSPSDLSVVLRTRQFIEAGTQITINYVSPIFGLPKRKQHIMEEWYFECRCKRCSDDTEFGTYASALKCSMCREGLILPHSNIIGDSNVLWRCRNCNNPFELEFITNYVQALEDELYTISKSKSCTPQQLEQFIKGHFPDLHPNHYLNLIAKRNLIQVLSRDNKPTRETLNNLIKNCKSFKSIMNRLDPGYSEWMGFALKKINTAMFTLLKIDLNEKKVDKKMFAEKSEAVWASMREVEQCDLLCRPITYK